MISLKFIGIDDNHHDPPLWIEDMCRKTRLHIFWVFFIWYFIYFITVDVLLRIWIQSPHEDLSNSIEKYIIFITCWNLLWAYSIFLTFYFRSKYTQTMDELLKSNIIDVGQHNSLRGQLINAKHRHIIWILLLLFVIAHIVLSFNNHIPSIIFGVTFDLRLHPLFISIEKIVWVLHWIPGVLVQLMILADLFVMIIYFIFLGKKISKIARIDTLNADGHGGLGSIGDFYYKVSLAYLIGLLFFIILGISCLRPSNELSFIGDITQRIWQTSPNSTISQEPLTYFLAVMVLSLFGLFLFIYPQYFLHLSLKKHKKNKIEKIVNDLKAQNIDPPEKETIDNEKYLYSILLMSVLSEVYRMKTYPFSKDDLIKIVITLLLNNIIVFFKSFF